MLVPTSSTSKGTGSSPLAQQKNFGPRTETGCLFMHLPLIKDGGVGFVISKSIYMCIQKIEVVSERILHATFHGNHRVSITGVHAPTESGPTTSQDDYYASLAEHLEQLKTHDISFLAGDFNARRDTDSHHTLSEAVKRFCYHDQTNNNDKRLVNLCVEHNLCPAQSRFLHPHGGLWTWNHPAGSKHQDEHILFWSTFCATVGPITPLNWTPIIVSHAFIFLLTQDEIGRTRAKDQSSTGKKLKNTKDEFLLELSNFFEALALDDQSVDLSARYKSFVAEEVLGEQETYDCLKKPPNWKSKEIRLKEIPTQSLLNQEQGGGTWTPDLATPSMKTRLMHLTNNWKICVELKRGQIMQSVGIQSIHCLGEISLPTSRWNWTMVIHPKVKNTFLSHEN